MVQLFWKWICYLLLDVKYKSYWPEKPLSHCSDSTFLCFTVAVIFISDTFRSVVFWYSWHHKINPSLESSSTHCSLWEPSCGSALGPWLCMNPSPDGNSLLCSPRLPGEGRQLPAARCRMRNPSHRAKKHTDKTRQKQKSRISSDIAARLTPVHWNYTSRKVTEICCISRCGHELVINTQIPAMLEAFFKKRIQHHSLSLSLIVSKQYLFSGFWRWPAGSLVCTGIQRLIR